nr:WAT1-related protein At2g39510-like [Ipomoea batatas]
MARESLAKFSTMAKPYLAVIFLQFGFAGMAIIAKSALNKGMSHYTFAAYRNLIAALVIAPFAIFFERKVRPKMTFSIFLKIMVLALLEPVIDQNLYFAGMNYTTATFTTALCNVLPAIAFILAWILRLEKVEVRKLHSQAKILGTVVTLGGAMIMTLVRGPNIGLPWTKHTQHLQTATVLHSQQDLVKGAAMIMAGCSCWAIFYILQAITLKSYPAGLSLTTLICTVGSLQASVVTLVAERKNPAVWALHWDTELLAYIYCASKSINVVTSSIFNNKFINESISGKVSTGTPSTAGAANNVSTGAPTMYEFILSTGANNVSTGIAVSIGIPTKYELIGSSLLCNVVVVSTGTGQETASESLLFVPPCSNFGYAGLTIVVKFALNQGMSPYTYLVYRNVFAALAVAPFAIFFERKVRPKMTISTFLKITVLGLVGPGMQLFYLGMQYTTATFTASLYNVLHHYILVGMDPQQGFGNSSAIVGSHDSMTLVKDQTFDCLDPKHKLIQTGRKSAHISARHS